MNADQEAQAEARPPAQKTRLRLSALLPVIALVLSIFSLYVSEIARRDVARMEVIKTEYGLFHDLAQLQLQNPLMAHLFVVTDQAYDSTVEEIKTSAATISKSELARMRLQERSFAHYLFTTYEEAYYLWQQAAASGDDKRAEMAQDDLNYFNAAFKNNPRLLWYWDFKGGKLNVAFAPELQVYYKDNVLKDSRIDPDPTGPFRKR